MTRLIGLHIRCNEHLGDITQKAMRFNLEIFQCFLRHQDSTLLQPKPEELENFKLYRQQYKQLYAHASYKINLADTRLNRHPALREEINLARQLEFTHIIIHPGAADDKQQGIDSISRQLNFLTKHVSDITLVLENVAFGQPSLGGDLQDIANIIHKLDRPESVGICIDTAHAYAFGYNLAQHNNLDQFITLVGEIIGFQKISLIHINDTQTHLGSRHDVHCRMGQGTIGQDNLKRLALNKQLSHIPIICELPTLPEDQELEDLQIIQAWHTAP